MLNKTNQMQKIVRISQKKLAELIDKEHEAKKNPVVTVTLKKDSIAFLQSVIEQINADDEIENAHIADISQALNAAKPVKHI